MLCLENFNIFLRDIFLVPETVKNEGIGEIGFDRAIVPVFRFSCIVRTK